MYTTHSTREYCKESEYVKLLSDIVGVHKQFWKEFQMMVKPFYQLKKGNKKAKREEDNANSLSGTP